MGNCKAVIFDMDGVLFDTESICLKAWEEVGREYGLREIAQTAVDCIGLNLTDTEEVFRERYGRDIDFELYHGECTRHFKESIERDGLPLKPGVWEILTFLKKRGCPVGLASSSLESSVRKHIQRAGIGEFFQVVVGGDMVKHSKPLPDIYLLACEKLGVAPEDTAAIEDSPNGLRSAYAAGMRPIMVPDLIAPTPQIEALLWKRCNNLLEVKAFGRYTRGYPDSFRRYVQYQRFGRLPHCRRAADKTPQTDPQRSSV